MQFSGVLSGPEQRAMIPQSGKADAVRSALRPENIRGSVTGAKNVCFFGKPVKPRTEQEWDAPAAIFTGDCAHLLLLICAGRVVPFGSGPVTKIFIEFRSRFSWYGLAAITDRSFFEE